MRNHTVAGGILRLDCRRARDCVIILYPST